MGEKNMMRYKILSCFSFSYSLHSFPFSSFCFTNCGEPCVVVLRRKTAASAL